MEDEEDEEEEEAEGDEGGKRGVIEERVSNEEGGHHLDMNDERIADIREEEGDGGLEEEKHGEKE